MKGRENKYLGKGTSQTNKRRSSKEIMDVASEGRTKERKR